MHQLFNLGTCPTGLYWRGETPLHVSVVQAHIPTSTSFAYTALVSEPRVSAFNFVVAEIARPAVNNIGWRTLLMFGISCMAMGLFILLFAKEAKVVA